MSSAPSLVLSRFRSNPLWLALPAVLLLAAFFLFPMGRLFLLGVQDPQTGALTAEHYLRLTEAPVYWRILGITFRIAILTALFSVILGYPLALWLSRMDSRKQSLLALLVLLPFWTSYLVKTFAWMILLGHRGVLNTLFVEAGLIERPLGLMYNELGVIIGMVHAMMPLAVLTMLPVMNGIDRRLTLAAGTMGASRSQRFWLVYFPLSVPGAAAAGLLTFITSLGFFIVPAFLGGSGQTMLAQTIITQVQELVNWSFAAVLASLMVVAALISIWIYNRFFGLSTISGGSSSDGVRASSGILRRLGRRFLEFMAWISSPFDRFGSSIGNDDRGSAIYPVLALIFLIAPMLVVFPLAFTSASSLQFPPPGFSLRWFEQYVNSPVWISATIRSFGVALATAFCATVLGGLAALGLARSRSRWNGPLFALMLAPMVVPRIVIAVGLFYLMAQIGLVATNTGLVIGHTLLAIPYCFITIGAVLKSYDWRLNQAAETLGAGRLTILRRITLPLLRGGVIAAGLFAFVTSFDELTIAIFISGGLRTTLPKQMWDDMFLQLNPTLAAVSVVVLVIVTAILLAAQKLQK
ncbi:ABC transporter permease subunit [Paracoccus sp. Z118]|uniref:ABC transporter permease subunit n=1 Tax=Paracoccus sp. Z118 TaxID=2851017 RepID=UPI001C2BC617|nr:ABC transporter permease subunit [Paracoccus sp. Z118]MBV0891915.1 ABC transporter permease subunit [Paracoccus sp. Z118]